MEYVVGIDDRARRGQPPPGFDQHHANAIRRAEVDPEAVVLRQHGPHLRGLEQKFELPAGLLGITGQPLAGRSQRRFALLGLGGQP